MIHYIDTLVGSYTDSTEILYVIQVLLAMYVFYQSIWQRAHQPSFKTLGLDAGMKWLNLKLGQLGLFVHMIICVVAMVDGVQNLSLHTLYPHIFILTILFGTFLSKTNVIAASKISVDNLT